MNSTYASNEKVTYVSIVKAYSDEINDRSPQDTDIRAIEVNLGSNVTATIKPHLVTIRTDYVQAEAHAYFSYSCIIADTLVFYDERGLEVAFINFENADYTVKYWNGPTQ